MIYTMYAYIINIYAYFVAIYAYIVVIIRVNIHVNTLNELIGIWSNQRLSTGITLRVYIRIRVTLFVYNSYMIYIIRNPIL